MPCTRPAALALALLAGCAPSTQVGQDGSARSVVEGVFEAFNRHDARALAAFYAPDAVLTSSEYCEPFHGPDAVQQLYQELFSAVPDVRDELTDIVAQGDKVAVRFTASSHLPGREFTIEIADFFEVRDGLIVSDRTVFNVGQPCRSSSALPAATP